MNHVTICTDIITHPHQDRRERKERTEIRRERDREIDDVGGKD